MSYLTQMAGLTVHNFVSAATGIALAIALIRGFARRTGAKYFSTMPTSLSGTMPPN
jgi:K+-transporting ATPase A subunit